MTVIAVYSINVVYSLLLVFAYPFHFGKSGFSAYFSRQIRISGFYPDFCAGPHRPL